MLAVSARVATWVSVAKVLGFSVHLPPLSEAIQTELKTSSVSTAGNSYCWPIILTFFHYIITTLHVTLLMVSFFTLSVSFTVSCSRLVARQPWVYRRNPLHCATIPSGTARWLSSSFWSNEGLGIDPSDWGSCERCTGWCEGRRPSRDLLSGIPCAGRRLWSDVHGSSRYPMTSVAEAAVGVVLPRLSWSFGRLCNSPAKKEEGTALPPGEPDWPFPVGSLA